MAGILKRGEAQSSNLKIDLVELFKKLNTDNFQGKIRNVEVKWSARMTVCAGICTYHGKKEGAVIHLSKPLMSLRTRRDLVDILLHEMIHAYLYIVDGNKEREEHGPKFLKIMAKINAKAGTKITVFHTFDDEVEFLKKHWWRCTGNCKKLPPMFGLVMRSMNRAPGPAEDWWKQHEKACTGNFVKVKEPTPPRPQLTAKRRTPSTCNSSYTSTKPSVKRRNSTPCPCPYGNKENTKPKPCPGRKRVQSTTCVPTKSKSRSSYKKPKRSEARAENSESDSDSDGMLENDPSEEDVFPEECNYCPACGVPLSKQTCVEDHLLNCPVLNTDADDELDVLPNDVDAKYPCPICHDLVTDAKMNSHLDQCLN